MLAADPDFILAVRELLSDETATDGSSMPGVAPRAAAACQALSEQLARLVGDLGTRTLFDRSLHLATSAFPWVATAKVGAAQDPYVGLRTCLEQQPPAAALPAAERVVVAYVELLERFIGTPLVTTLVHEAWPTVFLSAPKEIA